MHPFAYLCLAIVFTALLATGYKPATQWNTADWAACAIFAMLFLRLVWLEAKLAEVFRG